MYLIILPFPTQVPQLFPLKDRWLSGSPAATLQRRSTSQHLRPKKRRAMPRVVDGLQDMQKVVKHWRFAANPAGNVPTYYTPNSIHWRVKLQRCWKIHYLRPQPFFQTFNKGKLENNSKNLISKICDPNFVVGHFSSHHQASHHWMFARWLQHPAIPGSSGYLQSSTRGFRVLVA